MKRAPCVSVIIPTYNHAHFLREALVSVTSQTFQDWEAIVVNNYSDDDTVDVVASFDDPRIRLDNFRNHGIIAASRNRGIALAGGKYLAFLDSDDLWYPAKLERCIDRLERGCDLVCHGLRWIGAGVRERDVFFGPERHATFNALVYNLNSIVTSATVARKDLVEAVGRFSEDPKIVTAEDYHLWIKLARAGCRTTFIREILGFYRVHSGNQTGASVVRHLEAGLRVAADFLPPVEARGFITRMRIRRRFGMGYYCAGRMLQKNRAFGDAWGYFLRCAAYWPFYARLYPALALNLVESTGALNLWRQQRHPQRELR